MRDSAAMRRIVVFFNEKSTNQSDDFTVEHFDEIDKRRSELPPKNSLPRVT
jgi:hypothetical protein